MWPLGERFQMLATGNQRPCRVRHHAQVPRESSVGITAVESHVVRTWESSYQKSQLAPDARQEQHATQNYRPAQNKSREPGHSHLLREFEANYQA